MKKGRRAKCKGPRTIKLRDARGNLLGWYRENACFARCFAYRDGQNKTYAVGIRCDLVERLKNLDCKTVLLRLDGRSYEIDFLLVDGRSKGARGMYSVMQTTELRPIPDSTIPKEYANAITNEAK